MSAIDQAIIGICHKEPAGSTLSRIPLLDSLRAVRCATTTDTPGYLIMECPGIEFVTASFEEWIVGYTEQNPDATPEQKQEDWNKLLRRINCDEFTTDNIQGTIDQLPESYSANTVSE